VRKAENLPPSCAVVTKSGNLNFLEPCGPLQACNGTALALPFTLLCCLLALPLFHRFLAQHENQPMFVYDYPTVLLTCGFEASRMTAICE